MIAIKPCPIFSFMLVLTLVFVVGCYDNPAVPEYGTVSGAVYFSGIWPETGTISISLNTSWPEVTGAPYTFKTITSDNLNQENLYSYSFENVAFGTYQGIIVSWKDPMDTSSTTNQHAIGGYGVTQDEFEDAWSITISEVDYEITDLDFSADLDLIDETVPAESGTISGTVTFSGDWPIGSVSICLNTLWPLQTSPVEFSTISSENLIDNKYNYSFEHIIFGTYIIAVVWLPPGGGVFDYETLGAYGSVTPPEFEDAERVVITATDFELSGLNFTAIFGN